MQHQDVVESAPDRASRRKVVIIVVSVVAALFLYFSSLTIMSSMQILDFGPSKGTISYAPDRVTQTQQLTLEAGQQIAAAAFSPDGSLSATSGGDSIIELRHLPDGKRVGTLDAASPPTTIFFSPNSSNLVAATTDNVIHVWDVSTSQPLYAPLQAGRALKVVTVSADGQRINAAGTDGTLLIWQLVNGHQLMKRGGKLPTLEEAAIFSEDGNTLAYADPRRGIVLWSLEKDEEAQVFDTSQPSGRVVALAFSHLGGLLAVQDEGGQVQIFQNQTGRRIQAFRWAGPASVGRQPISSSSFSADARMFVLGGDDGRIELWDAQQGQLRATLSGPSSPVRALGFTDDGTTMESANGDGSMRLWQPGT